MLKNIALRRAIFGFAIILCGIVILFAWYFSTAMLAVVIYATGFIIIMLYNIMTLTVRPTIEFGKDLSYDFLQIKTLASSGIINTIRFILSETAQAACWPSLVVIILLVSVGRVFVKPKHRQSQINKFISLYPIQILLLFSYIIQFYIYIMFIQDNTRDFFSSIFVYIHVTGLVCLVLSLLFEPQLMKNFSKTVVPPLVNFVLTGAALLWASSLSEIMLNETLTINSDQTQEHLFQSLRRILLSIPNLDLLNVVDASTTFSEFFTNLFGTMKALSLIEIYQVFLSVVLVSVFGRSFFVALRFQRDDDDHQALAGALAIIDRFDQASLQSDQIHDDSSRALARTMVFASMGDFRQYCTFAKEIVPGLDQRSEAYIRIAFVLEILPFRDLTPDFCNTLLESSWSELRTLWPCFLLLSAITVHQKINPDEFAIFKNPEFENETLIYFDIQQRLLGTPFDEWQEEFSNAFADQKFELGLMILDNMLLTGFDRKRLNSDERREKIGQMIRLSHEALSQSEDSFGARTLRPTLYLVPMIVMRKHHIKQDLCKDIINRLKDEAPEKFRKKLVQPDLDILIKK